MADKHSKIVRAALDNPTGKALLMELKALYVDEVEVSSDTHSTYYALGQRSIVDQLIRIVYKHDFERLTADIISNDPLDTYGENEVSE